MKVTFEKEIDLSQVPFEVDRAFKDSLSQLATLNSMLQDLDPTMPKQFVEKLNFVRMKLFDIDSFFDECIGQMRGYVDALENEISESSLEEENSEKIEEVNESLAEFEKNMKNIMEATHAPSPHITSPLSMPDPSEMLKKMKPGGEK